MTREEIRYYRFKRQTAISELVNRLAAIQDKLIALQKRCPHPEVEMEELGTTQDGGTVFRAYRCVDCGAPAGPGQMGASK